MRERLLHFLACPRCHADLKLHVLQRASDAPDEIETGLLHCAGNHAYPIVRRIPRMLPDSLAEHFDGLSAYHSELDAVLGTGARQRLISESAAIPYDRRTKANFSNEWASWEQTDGTWGMSQEGQVDGYFVRPMKELGAEGLIKEGSVILDAGCGPGMPSLGYGRLGLEVLALDLSTGLEHGERIRRTLSAEERKRVHFVQGDLLNPPFKSHVVDIVSSLGVISSTPSTKAGFDSIARVLKPDGVQSVWVYSYERGVTEVVESIRAVTTRMPSDTFDMVAKAMSPAFVGFCWLTNVTGLREYNKMSVKSAHIALMDIFGAPYCHHHTFEEVEGWYAEHGFHETRRVAISRRGFGVIGRRSAAPMGAQAPRASARPNA